MAAPRLSRHLRDALGPAAGEDLMLILDDMRADHAALRAGIHEDFVAFRREMQALLQEFEKRMDARFDKVDERFDKVDARFEKIEARCDALEHRLGALEVQLAHVKGDLMKWSFVFWCGAVTAIAALARVLER